MSTVLITGANRGLGLALARHYAADGARVIGCCRDPGKADALRDLAAKQSGRLKILQLDVADDASIAALKRELSDQPIDILINNAGINGTPKEQTAFGIDAKGWMETVRVNSLAPVLISQALFSNLKLGREKKIAAITSDFGSLELATGWPSTSNIRERYAYCASKAALNIGMRALSRDWAEEGVLVLLVNPGFVRTDMTGARGAASPASISAEKSAHCIASRIAELTRETSGSCRNFDGSPIPW